MPTTKALNVLMVSTSYPRNATDWRGVFIKHIADAVADISSVNLHLWSPPGDISAKVSYICNDKESTWLNKLMDTGGIAHAIRSKQLSGVFKSIQLLVMLRNAYNRLDKQIDLYHVNWLQNILPLKKGYKPILVTVLGQDFGLLKMPGMTKVLRQKIKQRPCIIAPNADWMVPELKIQFGDIASIKPIPFGIDESWFQIERHLDSALPRKWLVVSRITEKKIGPLFKWGSSIFQNENELHLFGPMQENLEIPSWVHYHGSTHSRELIERWFPSAIALITLSQHHEGRPQVMLEAMAAGLPILASRLPAHEDIITHHQTGCLVDNKEDFVKEIEYINDLEKNKMLGQQASFWVRTNFGTWADCAQRYFRAYQDLMG